MNRSYKLMEAQVSQRNAFVVGSVGLVVLTGLLLSHPVHAQTTGRWSVKLGVNQINPQVTSGNLSAPSLPGSKVDVKSASAAILTVTYFHTDQLSLEAFFGLPYKHDLIGDGAVNGVGRLATTKQVSPTVFAQYRIPVGASPVRPYVGLGPTYVYFFDEQGSGTLTALTNPGGTPTRLSIDSAWGVSGQVGATWDLADRWYLDASVIKTYVKTTNRLSTGQSIDVKLDPVSFNVSLGYRF